MPQTPSAFGSGAKAGASEKPLGYMTSKRLLETIAHEYGLITNFANGYRNREDTTILVPGTMVTGSQNVLTNTFRRLQNRQGYTLFGPGDTSGAPILSWFDYAPVADEGQEVHGRAGFQTGTNNGKMQFLYTTNAGDYHDGTTYAVGVPLWIDLLTGLTSVEFNTTQWSPTITPSFPGDPASLILMVNGTNQLYVWTGAMGSIKSVNNNSGVISSLSVGFAGSSYVVGDIIAIGGGTGGTATVTEVVDRGITGVSVAEVGSSYMVGDVVTLLTPLGSGASLEVATVNDSGGITSLSVAAPGQDYNSYFGVALVGGSGTDATVNITGLGFGSVSAVTLTNGGSGYMATTESTTGGSGTGLTLIVGSILTGQIILNGTPNVTQQNFLTTGQYQQQANINGTVYTYRQALGNVLSGITPNPTTEPANSVIFQVPFSYATTSIDGYTLPTIDLISSLASQVYYGTLTDSNIFMSKVQNYLDVTGSSIVNFFGSAQGDGAQITLDIAPTAFLPQVSNQDLNTMSVFAGEDFLYNVNTVFGSTTVGTGTDVQSIPTQNVTAVSQKLTRKQGAQSQKWTTKNKNDIIYLSFSPTLNSFGLVDNILQTQQIKNLSFPIVNDFNDYDFTDGSVTFDKDFIYVSVPKEGLLRIYNQTDQVTYLGDTPSMQETATNFYWEAPQTIPITGVSIIYGNLYGHSYASSETYQLFTGWRDRATSVGVGGSPILAKAVFCYHNYGVRFVMKLFRSYYFEGNITTNTTLNVSVYYDYSKTSSPTIGGGYSGTSQTVLPMAPDNSLGITKLGTNPLGSTLMTTNPNGTPNPFRVALDFPIQPFFQEQTTVYSDKLDAQWQIVAYGTNATNASEYETFIHQALQPFN